MLRKAPLLFLLLPSLLHSQPAQKWDLNLLTGVIWSFEMTYEAVSGDIIDTADTLLICDLLLNADQTYELFDRDQLSRGIWKAEGDNLLLSFRRRDQFTLLNLKPDMLELRFTVGFKSYIHRFRRQTTALLSPSPSRPATRTWITGERTIRIELTGGGYFGGADPVQRDFILIKEDGRLIHERQTVNKGLRVSKKDLSNRQLAELADFIRASGFFEMKMQYGCESTDCEKRLQAQPKPIPLRLAVTDGLDRHVVEVAIWPESGAETSPIAIPTGLVRIVQTIRGLTSE